MRKTAQSKCYNSYLNPQDLWALEISVALSKHKGRPALIFFSLSLEYINSCVTWHWVLCSHLEPPSLARACPQQGPYMTGRGACDYKMVEEELQGREWGRKSLRARPLRSGKWRLENIGKREGIKGRWYPFLLLSQYHGSIYSEKQPAAAPK